MPLLRLVHAFLASIGRSTLGLLGATGRLTIFAAAAVSHLVRPPFYPAELGRQLLRIGYFSLPVVGLTALFTGAALALQIWSGGDRFNAGTVVPSIVAIGIVRWQGHIDEMDASTDPYLDQFIHGRATGPIESVR